MAQLVKARILFTHNCNSSQLPCQSNITLTRQVDTGMFFRKTHGAVSKNRCNKTPAQTVLLVYLGAAFALMIQQAKQTTPPNTADLSPALTHIVPFWVSAGVLEVVFKSRQ